jgi:Protein of unknown function (DUF2950)
MTRLAYMHNRIALRFAAAALTAAFGVLPCSTTAQQVFDSPDAAVDALVAVAKSNDEAAALRLFGPKSRNILDTVDRARDRELRARFAAAADDYHALRRNDDGSLTLIVGYQWWPLPIPLVNRGAGWQFDIDAGADEIAKRRIGANELDAIAMMHGFVEAQRVYARESRDGSGVRDFARKLVSASGRKDGLYWVADNSKGEALSPFVAMIGEPGGGDSPMLRNGYRYRILTAQGGSAPGGAYRYMVNGRLLAGFALIAYPAQYRKTGVMTFIVNHYGDVYEKNLGPDTATIAARMGAYAPDASWRRIDD